MDYHSPDYGAWPTRLVVKIGKRLRSDKKFTEETRRKNEERAEQRRLRYAERHGFARKSADLNTATHQQQGVNELGEREYSVFNDEHKDHTDMMHRLAHHDSFDSLVDQTLVKEKLKDPYFDASNLAHLEAVNPMTAVYQRQFAMLPDEVWQCVASYLNPTDAASLALSTKTLNSKLGKQPFRDLDTAENLPFKIAFLRYMDYQLARQLFCFQCNKYHLRLKPGKEWLKADYVANPLFTCPNVRSSVLPRMRITHGRELPYSFVQLATRARRHTPVHGIEADTMERRWKGKGNDWSHRTRYMVFDGRLLMRVVSHAFALPDADMTETRVRHLLYDREEYTPFFSVCAHWKDGLLMPLIKCALSHVPQAPVSYLEQLKKAPKINRALANPNFIVRMCDDCRPARRCPECPTEYLIEIQMAEDKNDPVRPFKHCLVVTRWSDLGDGSSPFTNPEWTAINGIDSGTASGAYESFSHVGRRAVSGIFESHISGSIPGQRMLSLNPKNKKEGDEGHGWY